MLAWIWDLFCWVFGIRSTRRSRDAARRLGRRARRVAEALRQRDPSRLPERDGLQDLPEGSPDHAEEGVRLRLGEDLTRALRRPKEQHEAAGHYLAYRRAGGAWLAEAMPLAEVLARQGAATPALVPLYLEYLLGSPDAPERSGVEAALRRACESPDVPGPLRALAGEVLPLLAESDS